MCGLSRGYDCRIATRFRVITCVGNINDKLYMYVDKGYLIFSIHAFFIATKARSRKEKRGGRYGTIPNLHPPRVPAANRYTKAFGLLLSFLLSVFFF
jgi:hypothetical protein